MVFGGRTNLYCKQLKTRTLMVRVFNLAKLNYELHDFLFLEPN